MNVRPQNPRGWLFLSATQAAARGRGTPHFSVRQIALTGKFRADRTF